MGGRAIVVTMVILIHGDNSLRSRVALRNYIKKLRAGDFIVEEHDTQAIDYGFVEEYIQASSLFASNEKKALVLSDFFVSKKAKEYNDIIEGVFDSKTRVVVLYDRVNTQKNAAFHLFERGVVIDCSSLPRREAVQWLYDAIPHQERLSHTIIQNVFDRCGGDMWLAYNELNKIDTYCFPEQATADVVASSVDSQLENTVFKTIDALFGKKRGVAFRELRQHQANGVSALLVLGAIERHIRIVELIREQVHKGVTNSSALSATIKVPPFVVRKSLPFVQQYSAQKGIALYERLATLDEKIKRGLIDPYFACELMFFAVVVD